MRIKQLCSDALAADTPQDAQKVLGELRSALEDHIRCARNDLGARVIAFPILDAHNKKCG
jgi:hypothetical protein